MTHQLANKRRTELGSRCTPDAGAHHRVDDAVVVVASLDGISSASVHLLCAPRQNSADAFRKSFTKAITYEHMTNGWCIRRPCAGPSVRADDTRFGRSPPG